MPFVGYIGVWFQATLTGGISGSFNISPCNDFVSGKVCGSITGTGKVGIGSNLAGHRFQIRADLYGQTQAKGEVCLIPSRTAINWTGKACWDPFKIYLVIEFPFWGCAEYKCKMNDDGSRREVRVEPIDAGPGSSADSMLWREFCSEESPEVRVVPTRLGTRYELVGQTLGNRGLTTCVQGGVTRGFAPRFRDELNRRGDFSAQINAPTEHLLFDLIVHRDLADEIRPEALVLQAGTVDPGEYAGAARIPCSERLRRLESVPPRLSTPLYKRYAELTARVYERMGWKAEEFRAMRFEMKCPPLNSVVLLHYELPEQP